MGEYEPRDSRNVTGTAQTQDGRWTAQGQRPPNAAGQMDQSQQGGSQQAGQGQMDQGQMDQGKMDQSQMGQSGSDGSIQFEPDPQLSNEVASEVGGGGGQMNQSGSRGQSFDADEAYQAGRSHQAGSSGIADQMDQGAQMSQSGQSVGQSGEGVSNATNQSNDHTSGIGQEQQFDAMGESEMNQPATGQAGQTGWSTGNAAGQVRHGQSVVDSQGQHVGTVDHVDGDRIKLARKDSPDGQHHYLSASQVESCEGDQVRLSCTADQLSG